MKKILITFTFRGEKKEFFAVLNDDINAGTILADHSLNDNVSAECGMADELGIWHLLFTDNEGIGYECDFLSRPNTETMEEILTLEPVEVFVWTKSGTSLNNHAVEFNVEEVPMD